MTFLKKYIIIVLAILILAINLPTTYDNILSKRGTSVDISFSPVKEDFIKTTLPVGENRDLIYSSLDEKENYTREEFQALFPFTYYLTLIKWNKFPEKFNSFKDNVSMIMNSWQFIFLSPDMINYKNIGLYPLYESNSKFLDIVVPDDFFRMNNKIEFINIAKNKTELEKSELFTKVLKEKGFKFPMTKVFGNLSAMKPFDEGYFIIDNEKKLFHLKMKNNKPYINKIETPNIDIKYIHIFENKRKEFYGLVLDKMQNLYLLMYDDYEFIKLPIDKFDYKTDFLHLKTDPIYRHIILRSFDKKTQMNIIKMYITDLDYELVKKHSYEYEDSMQKTEKTIKDIIFPFVVTLENDGSYKKQILINDFSKNALIFNILILLIYLIYIKLSRRELKKHLINMILILCGGIYALIAITAFYTIVQGRKRI